MPTKSAAPAGADSPGVTDVKSAARRLGISKAHAYNLIREGQFPVRTIRMGNRIVVPVAALDDLLSGAA